MPLLTLCMPSNRNLERSHQAIEQALAYCEARDAVLLLSDNSGDAEKEKYWRGRSPRLIQLISKGTTRLENFLTSVAGVETPFLLQIGDDDGIGMDPNAVPFDLATLPADYMGARVKTEVTITGRGVVRTKEFAIESDTPSGRIVEYSKKAGGDNSAFYSIFRTDPYVKLRRLFTEHHPTRGEYCDWAMVFALFAYGRMAYDPATIFRYNADVWSDLEKIKEQNQQLFATAGLPPEAERYQALLMALDVFIFAGRTGTPLAHDQALDATSMAAGGLINGFLGDVRDHPEHYSETLRYIADLARKEVDSFARFQLGLMMIDQLKPGLKDAYVAFYRAANGL